MPASDDTTLQTAVGGKGGGANRLRVGRGTKRRARITQRAQKRGLHSGFQSQKAQEVTLSIYLRADLRAVERRKYEQRPQSHLTSFPRICFTYSLKRCENSARQCTCNPRVQKTPSQVENCDCRSPPVTSVRHPHGKCDCATICSRFVCTECASEQ